jgi:hypothetical protein
MDWYLVTSCLILVTHSHVHHTSSVPYHPVCRFHMLRACSRRDSGARAEQLDVRQQQEAGGGMHSEVRANMHQGRRR